MSRRRYISTEISVDRRINELSDFAALLYTWMIAHADDDGAITSDPDEIAWTVIPGRRKKRSQVEEALQEIKDQGLLLPDGDGQLLFPSASFYRYQTYIPAAKRRYEDPNAEDSRDSAQKAFSPSPSPSKNTSYSREVASIFTYWQSVMESPKSKLTQDRRAKIEARLREGYTVEDIQRGIDGCKATPWNMGENPQGKRYNDFDLICRNGAKLESFMALSDKPKTGLDVLRQRWNR